MKRIAVAALAVLVSAPLAAQAPVAPPDPKLLARAERILTHVPVIDGHNDLPSELIERFGGDPYAAHLDTGTPQLQTDLPRLRAGHVGAQFWSAFVANDSIATGAALRVALREIDMIHRMVRAYPGTLQLATTTAEIERIQRAGRVASLIGVEGGHAIQGSLAALRALHALGARYLTLTHNTTLPWADAAVDVAAHQGLTPFGEEVVREMNRLGMFVDLSHVSPDVMRDALRVSRAPVIFSHSSARALLDHPRNVPDDVLQALGRNGGVVMVNFCPCFTAPGRERWTVQRDSVVRELRADTLASADDVDARYSAWLAANPAPRATLSDIADHVDHLVKVAGVDHVGIGSDYDGISGEYPLGLPDVGSYPVLFAELLRRGYSEADLKKIAGLNLLRAMREMEGVAKRLQATERPRLGEAVPAS